ncbi:MAG: TRAP transporter small permease [Desulfobacteraceae bacterium]|jgi:TRAP-type C4-dicarboxylate transport system permease small subunit
MIAKIASMVTRILLAMGAAVLAMMMFLTAIDVFLRYLFNSPISGAFELVEFMMAIFIPFSIVYCAEQKNHVAVELVLGRFPARIQNFFNIITTLITMLFALVIAWQNYLYIEEMFTSQMTSSVLLIPVYPFVAPVAIGITAFALVLLPQWFDLFKSK